MRPRPEDTTVASEEPPQKTLHLGISTCPNDTYLFHGLLQGKIETPGLRLELELLDVQELNERLARGEFDVAKASYHLALQRADDLVALPTGSALGFGNGPLLLARQELAETAPGPDSRVLCPGGETTATLLYRLYYSLAKHASAEPQQVVFSDVMPALEAGEADYGVCIHEGRFTYGDKDLCLIEDLGAAWESDTKSPLPLGGLFARRSLDDETIDRVTAAIQRSLRYADEHREETLQSMAPHAQELEEAVIWEHVDLYVNDWTRRLGHVGEAAIQALSERAQACGLLQGQALEVFVPRRERRLFHMVRADGEQLNRSSEEILASYAAASLETEGFVHLSFADQLSGSLETHFGDAERVLLLELDRQRVIDDLRLEASRGGADFPHLYRALDTSRDVLRCSELLPNPSQTKGAPRWPLDQRALLMESSS